MKARINEMIWTDEGIHNGNTYEVDDLSEELQRLDRSGAIFTVVSSVPDVQLEGMSVTICFAI